MGIFCQQIEQYKRLKVKALKVLYLTATDVSLAIRDHTVLPATRHK